MKTYLFLNDCVHGGGAEKVMLNIAKYLSDRGARVIVCAKGDKKTFYQEYPKQVKFFPAEFSWLPEVKRFSLPWLLQRFRYAGYCLQSRYYSRKKYTVVAAMKEGSCMKQALEYSARRHIGWVHVDYRFLHWTKYCYSSAEEERQCMTAFEKVICVSRAAMQSVIETIGDPGNLCLCYNPVPVEEIRWKAQLPCDTKKPTEGPLFVAVGRMAKEKQYMMLLQVCAELAKQYSFTLWLVGDGYQRAELAAFVKENHLDHVHLLGASENPYALMRQADCFVSTSEAESYGLAVQEALILGVPVLTTACPAMYEVLDPRFGKVIPNDASHLYQAMEQIIRDPACLEQMRQQARENYPVHELWQPRLDAICAVLEGT